MWKKLQNYMQKEQNKYYALLISRNRHRMWITIITIVTFMLLVAGLGYTLILDIPISADWRELLLLLLGAFITSYGRVMDFWFNNSEKDIELIKSSTELDKEKEIVKSQFANKKTFEVEADGEIIIRDKS